MDCVLNFQNAFLQQTKSVSAFSASAQGPSHLASATPGLNAEPIIGKIKKRIEEKKTFFSFEYFPPKTQEGVTNLYARLVCFHFVFFVLFFVRVFFLVFFILLVVLVCVGPHGAA